MSKDVREGKDRTPDTETSSLTSVPSRRRGIIRTLTNRLRIAAHLSRAKRAEELTEPTIDLLVDNHELYMRSDPKVMRSNSKVNNMTTALNNINSVNKNQLQSTTLPLLDRQISRLSASNEKVFVNNRYILSHGMIHFWQNYAYGEGKPYIKVSHDVHIEDIAYIMHRNWKMESPRIVALIISNVASLHDWSNTRQMTAFKKGLMKAANSTNMWVFTNGINTGASKLIGDAVCNEIKESKAYKSQSNINLNCVGIMREDHLRYGKNIGGDGSDRVQLQNEGNDPEEGKYELNDNHTHYIIVKDNTVSKTGINLFALRIIQYLSTVAGKAEFASDFIDNGGDSSEDRVNMELCSLSNMEIPVISILIQGGYDCARLVLDHLKRRNPVVVLRGSGGLADLLAFAYLEMQQRCRDLVNAWDAEFVESFLKPELSNKIVNRFPKLRSNTLARNIFRDRILECIRLSKQSGRIYLSVLNMHNSSCNLENLSEYLLKALFKSQHAKTSSTPNVELLLKDLYLTLDWNCPHVAQNEVLSRDPSVILKLEKSMFESALTRSNREEFVDLFLSHGFRLHKFVTPKRLKNLFKRIHEQEFFRSVCWEGVLGKSYGSKLDKNFIDVELNWLIESCTELNRFVSSQDLYLNVMGLYPTDAASAERKALAILTMWAVFGNRQKLAKVLWKHSDQPIHLGLVISMMLERLSWYVGEQNLKTELKDPSKVFADYAVGVLDSCFSQDETRANDVLSEESSDWNYKTAVDIAANARLRSFLGHPCCQKWLTNTFLGNVRIREMSWGFFTIPPSIKILLSALFIFPMYIWVRFREEKVPYIEKMEDIEDERDAADEEQHLMHSEPGGGGGGANLVVNMNTSGGDTVESMLFTKPVEIVTKNIDNITKHGKHYSTLIRQREVFIKRQPPLWKMIYLMWNAPITKFWTFQVFYIIFLGLFSLALIWPNCGNYYLDISVCLWTALILVEYVRRTLILYRKYTSVPMVFKCIEIILIIKLVVVYSCGRVFFYKPLSPYTMKIYLSFGLLYFYYRLFAVHLPISPTLGPLLYRLRLMITVDFVNFMRMALLVVCSSGFVLQAVMYPDTQLSLEMLRTAFHRAFFAMFLTPVDELREGKGCDEYILEANETLGTCHASIYNQTNISCPTIGFWPYFFSIQYFVFLKLILMTLLYALFAATASRLQTETDNIWKFQRYILVVDFAHRLPLPAPLNIFCYIYFILRFVFRIITCYYCCRKKDQIDGKSNLLFPITEDDKYNLRLSEEDYNFWRHLAREFYNKEEVKNEESNIVKKEWEAVQTIGEEIEHEKKVLRQLKGKVTELERMMTQSHVYLENIKHLSIKKHGFDSYQSSGAHLIHFLSRHSPYLGTRVQRVPIPDKYVPYEVMWIDYDPVAYTKPKIDFNVNIQSQVDEDILLLQELQIEEVMSKLPILQWNMSSINPAGITIDRQSWIISEDGINLIYRLDNGIPLNPFGRTGLRGRGALPRWGPNHYVVLIITRWQSLKSSFAGQRVLEFVVEKTQRRDQLSLPVRFIGGESLYLDLQSLFKTSLNWTSSEEMIQFFKSAIVSAQSPTLSPPVDPTSGLLPSQGMKAEKSFVGYMDDPLNTDNAWKEIELWHIHYTSHECLSESMQLSQIHWRIITEDVFIKLPLGQASLMQELTNKLKPAIL